MHLEFSSCYSVLIMKRTIQIIATALLIIRQKVNWTVRAIKMEPPIHTEYLRSGGAIILIFMVLGAKAVISFCIRSAIPGYMVEPPDKTLLQYKSFLISDF